ncbi:MAG: hypothetical protein QG656_1345 [Candidatus Hydrogenedentes bacterium]|nr:hypothetical protein [Candidatus Hydrogenedentota bacterium]
MVRFRCSIFLLTCAALTACPPSEPSRDYRQDMRDFVSRIGAYAKAAAPDFAVIPQNGHELLTLDGEADGPIAASYVAAIDGVGREDLFYGYNSDNEATPGAERDYMLGFMDRAEASGIEVLTTDYCWTPAFADNAYQWNEDHGFIAFAADHRDLDDIPPYPAQPHNVNVDAVTSLADARNFLYVLEPSAFGTKEAYIGALAETAYDLFIIDLFFEDEPLTAADVAALKTKPRGGARLVIAYMSIGEAEDYRYYWQDGWRPGNPAWLAKENPDWAGNYKVRYWDPAWQAVILGNESAYLDRILAADFDGVYLDIIDAFEYFEE